MKKIISTSLIMLMFSMGIISCQKNGNSESISNSQVNNESINKEESSSVTEQVYDVKVTYNLNVANQKKEQTIKSNEPLTYIITPEREGYMLEGWYYDNETFNKRCEEGSILKEDITLYAKWVESVTITYYLSSDLSWDEVKVEKGSSYTLPEYKENREGYKFDYWTVGTEDKDALETIIVDKNITITANWIRLYSVSFVSEDENVKLPEKVWLEKGSSYKLPGLTIENEDKEFSGWQYQQQTYKAGDILTIETNNIELTALFAGIYELGFNLTGGEDNGLYETQEYASGSSVILPEGPTKEGYLFASWYDGEKEYKEAETYVMKSQNVTLEAIYVEAVEVTFIYNHYQKENEIVEKRWYALNQLMEETPIPEYKEHNFVGWYEDKECTTKIDFGSYKIKEDITLYASWEHEIYVFELVNNNTEYMIIGRNMDYKFSKEIYMPSVYQGKPVVGTYNAATSTKGVMYLLNHSVDNIKVETIHIPASYRQIGDYTFNLNPWVKDYIFEENSQCTYLGKHAFNGSKSVKEYTNFPTSISEIGEHCFIYNQSLVKMDLSKNNISELKEYTFARCFSLSEIKLPDTCISFGRACFNADANLTSLNIPEGTKEIPKDFLSACYVPADGKYSVEMVKMTWSDKDYNKVNPQEYTVNMKIQELVIPSTVNKINTAAFARCENLKKITFNNSVVEYFENYAFIGCTSLENVNVPKTVLALGMGTFYECVNLSSVTFEEDSELLFIYEYCFGKCEKMTKYDLPTSLLAIYGEAFKDNYSLKEFTFNEGLSAIGTELFENCNNLEKITLSSTISQASLFALSSLPSLKTVNFPSDFAMVDLEQYFFFNCTALESVTLPKSMKSIKTGVFNGCISLKEVLVEEGSTYLKSIDGILYSYDEKTIYVIPYILEGEVLTIKEGVEVIKDNACNSNYMYSNADGSVAYGEVRNNIKEIRLPSTIKQIDAYAFTNMKNVKRIVFAEGIENLRLDLNSFGNYARFQGDSADIEYLIGCELESIILPVKNIPTLKFAVNKPFNHSVYNKNFHIYVLDELVETFKTEETWGWNVYSQYYLPISQLNK